MTEYSGRLELTWTNKHQRLLALDEGRSYEWVDPSDHRVSEIRLLKDAGTVGDVSHDGGRAKDNLLIRGDALNALTSLVELPDFATEYRGKVKLVYIDPPFNTGQTFANYDDNLEHSVWLTMLRDRLVQVRELLAPDGSVWVHLDDREAHRARVVLDEIFGTSSFIATLIWQKRTSRDNRAAFSSAHDYIHVYAAAGTQWKDVRNRLPDEGAYSNPDNDSRGPWRSIPMSAQAGHATRAQFYTVTTPTGVKHDPPAGRAWTYTEDKFLELVKEGRVYWPRSGNGRPRLKRYPEESDGLVPFTLWPADEVGENSTAKSEIQALFPNQVPFDTPKPEELLKRVIEVATDPHDIVLDSFVGSGTTAAVAHKMGRRWVAVEWSEKTLATFTVPRLSSVVSGEDAGGISEAVGWEGGGGFRILDVAPSMFTEEDGVVYLADWAADEELVEPVAAQFGFHYDPHPPFAGRKGRSHLAVIDGLVNEDVIDLLVSQLPDGDRILIAGTAVATGADTHLSGRSPGSRVRKVPESILIDYHNTYRRRRRVELHLDQASGNEAAQNV